MRKENWQQAYQWRLAWTRAVDFVSVIEPFLYLKWPQAHMLFAWDVVRPGMGRPWDEDTKAFLIDRMHWLNARGVVTTTDPLDATLDVAREAKKKAKKAEQ